MHTRFVVWFSILTLTLATAQAGNVPTARKALEFAQTKFQAGPTNYMIRMEGVAADSDLRPRQWDVTFFDAKRANNGTVIRVKDGVVVSVGGAVRLIDDAQGSRFFRNFTGYENGEIIKLSRWKLDSDAVLSKIAGWPALAGVQLTDARMTLEKLSDGDVAPVWQVRIKARSRSNPGQEAWIGAVVLSAETGEVLKNETRPDRVLK